MTTPDTSTQKSNPNSRLSFHEFKKIKEDERVKKIKAKKRTPVEEVKIQIGGMEEAAGRLKKVKGRTLPLIVPTDITAGELPQSSNCKHGRQTSPQSATTVSRKQNLPRGITHQVIKKAHRQRNLPRIPTIQGEGSNKSRQ